MNFPMARFESLVIQELADEILICDTKTYRAFCLNKTAAEVWKLCDGSNDAKRIAEKLSAKFNNSVSEEIVWLALDQLANENLLQKDFSSARNFNGVSRREVIRRVGLVSMVALPIISSLVMPTAAHAQSGSIVCSDDSNCTAGNCCDTYNSVCAPAGSQGCVCSSNADCDFGLQCCAPGNPVCNPGC